MTSNLEESPAKSREGVKDQKTARRLLRVGGASVGVVPTVSNYN